MANSPQGLEENEQGKARDIVASKLKFTSGREVDRAINAINKIDMLKDEGHAEAAELIHKVLNNKSFAV